MQSHINVLPPTRALSAGGHTQLATGGTRQTQQPHFNARQARNHQCAQNYRGRGIRGARADSRAACV